ncbi:50S ribosomal protein L35ae [Candidatus Woesearchaeota archaeon]|nr:50S ribosomal protein L35ae [Candidatus Woesearchaeota archaeon]
MEGVIVNFRRGKRTQKTNQMVVKVEDINSKEKAEKLIGNSVSWTAPGKNKTTITGKISSVHGNSGAVRVLFERGMPGQAIGQKVVVS